MAHTRHRNPLHVAVCMTPPGLPSTMKGNIPQTWLWQSEVSQYSSCRPLGPVLSLGCWRYIARRSRPRGPRQAARVGQRLSRMSGRSLRRGYVTGSMTTTKVGIQHLQLGDSILLERLEQAAGCCMLNAWPAKKAVLLPPDRVPANNIGLLRRHMED